MKARYVCGWVLLVSVMIFLWACGGSAGIKCGSCGVDNKSDAAFCRVCGAKLNAENLCSCGHKNKADAKFCASCGKTLDESNKGGGLTPNVPGNNQTPAQTRPTTLPSGATSADPTEAYTTTSPSGMAPSWSNTTTSPSGMAPSWSNATTPPSGMAPSWSNATTPPSGSTSFTMSP